MSDDLPGAGRLHWNLGRTFSKAQISVRSVAAICTFEYVPWCLKLGSKRKFSSYPTDLVSWGPASSHHRPCHQPDLQSQRNPLHLLLLPEEIIFLNAILWTWSLQYVSGERESKQKVSVLLPSFLLPWIAPCLYFHLCFLLSSWDFSGIILLDYLIFNSSGSPGQNGTAVQVRHLTPATHSWDARLGPSGASQAQKLCGRL